MVDSQRSKEGTEMLEEILTTATARKFRNFVCNSVPLQSGDSVLSVGCGPGFETAVIADEVGAEGDVTGLDVNKDVLTAARDRCSDLPQVSFQHGDVTELQAADESFDHVRAKQVLQFVDDVDSALEEVFRVLKPGGRVTLVEAVRESQVLHSSDPERMQRAMEVYREARGDRQFGTRFVSLLPEAGFSLEEIVPRSRVHREINEQVEQGIEVQRGFLESSDAFDAAEVDAWEQELGELDDAGQFLFCGTTLLYLGRKPK